MVVLDLSREPGLSEFLLGESDSANQAEWLRELGERALATVYADADLIYPVPAGWTEVQAYLGICHQSLASGTNYSRGDDTTLVILFTRCSAEASNDPQD